MDYTIIIEKDKKTGFYSGQCQQLPEAISQGSTIDELLKNMKEAISLVVDYHKQTLNTTYEGRKVFRRKVAVV